MDLNIFKHTGRFLTLIAIQVVILNHIYFGGHITPHIYPLFILLLPFDVKGWVLLVAAFFSGLAVDMFSDSMGMHAAASVFMAFMRPTVIRLISIKMDFDQGEEPRIENKGLGWILLYTLILVFLHHLTLFIIEVFRFDELSQVLFRTLLSTGFSLLIIIIAHLLMGKQSKSRI